MEGKEHVMIILSVQAWSKGLKTACLSIMTTESQFLGGDPEIFHRIISHGYQLIRYLLKIR